MKAKLFALFVAFFQIALSAQEQKEILIIGTMHEVPKIVAASYRPLLRYAKKYAPEAILTEDIMPSDTVSLKGFTPNFLKKSIETLESSPIDEARFNSVMKKELTDMSADDFAFLRDEFLKRKDRANYHYYEYLSLYGLKGPSSSLRNESDDLTHRLAAYKGIKMLLPIDDHHNDKIYNKAWYEAVNSGASNGDAAKYIKQNKKSNRREIMPALFGRLGKHTNSRESLEWFYLSNSVRYVEHPNEKTDLARDSWDERNLYMARNIVHQVEASSAHKFLLVVGAGHVISIKKALAEIAPSVKVVLMDEE